MNGRCNTISLNETALMTRLKEEARLALTAEGDRLMRHMKREAEHTTHGGAPGKPAWRREIAESIHHTATAVTGDSVSMDFGYSPSDKPDEVRAMIVEAGSGSAVGNAPIHAGPTGRSVWDGDVTGKHPSRAKSEYDLTDAFNQVGNQFVENAMRMMQTEFGQLTEIVYATTPDSCYYGSVEVKER